MTFLAEMKKALSAQAGVNIEYCIAGGGGYFQNVRRIAEFSPQKVVFLGKAGGVSVEGENIRIAKYCLGDAVLLGDITKIEKVT